MKQEATAKTPVLWAIDFDQTLIAAHVAKQMALRGRRLKDDEFLANPAIGGAERWQKIFIDLMKRGDKIAIVTFGDYGKKIRLYLEQVIGLEKNLIDENVTIIAHYPQTQEIKNKNGHIAKALEIFKQRKCEISELDVILVDDDRENTAAWREEIRQAGFDPDNHTILANADGGHLERIEALYKQLDEDPDLLRKKLPVLTSSDDIAHSSSSEDEEEDLRSSAEDSEPTGFTPPIFRRLQPG